MDAVLCGKVLFLISREMMSLNKKLKEFYSSVFPSTAMNEETPVRKEDMMLHPSGYD